MSERNFEKKYLEILRKYREEGLLFDNWEKPLKLSHPFFLEYTTWYLVACSFFYFSNNLRIYLGIIAVIFSLPFFIMRGWQVFLLSNLRSNLNEEIESLGIRGVTLGNLESISEELVKRINSLKINISDLKTINSEVMEESLYIVLGAKDVNFLKTGFGSVGYIQTSEYFIWRFDFRKKVLNGKLCIDNWYSPTWSEFSSETKENKLRHHEKEMIKLACVLNGYNYQKISS